MTNRSSSRRGSADRSRRPPWLWIGLGIVVALAAVVALVASDDADPTTSADGVEETRAVEVTGAPLPPLAEGTDPAIGRPSPVVVGATFEGDPVTVGGAGKATVIVFLAHWCPHCQREVPILRDHLVDNPLPAAVDLITVATSTTPERPNYPPSAWLDREDWPGPILADSDEAAAGLAFGLPAFPYFVAVDRNGDVVARATGELTTDQFDALVTLALG